MVVVIFKTEMRADVDVDDYTRSNRRMREIVTAMPGFVSIKAYTAADGETVSIVRFRSREALDDWRTNPEHLAVQSKGRERYYQSYSVEVLDTIRAYEFTREKGRVPLASGA